MKGRVCEVRLGEKRGSIYGKSRRGMRSLRSSNFSNPSTSQNWLQLEPLRFLSVYVDTYHGYEHIKNENSAESKSEDLTEKIILK